MQFMTADLLLRPPTENDLPEVARMWAYPERTSLEDARAALQRMEKARRLNRPGAIRHLCLSVFERKDSRRIIGWCGLDGEAEPGKTVLFYIIDEAFRGCGYATQCAAELLRYAFEEMGYDKIYGGCAKENRASFRVMEKIGMRQDGFYENGDPAFSIDRSAFRANSMTFPQRVYGLVAQIPKGKVSTYGQLALLLGSPRASRIVGAAMARAPGNLPCHRVVYGDGRMSFPGSLEKEDQRRLLLEEGVEFLPAGRADLKRCLWDGANEID